MIILSYFPNLKKRYTAMAQAHDSGPKIDLLQYSVQDRVDYYLHEQMRMRNSQGMDDDVHYFVNNCRDVESSSLATNGFGQETSKAMRAPYPNSNRK